MRFCLLLIDSVPRYGRYTSTVEAIFSLTPKTALIYRLRIRIRNGFDSVDNLAEAPNGDLVMIEDNKPSDIWFASSKTDKFGASKIVKLFASLTDPEAEGTGIYFSPTDPKTLYVNIQHSAAEDGDGTWAITRGQED